MSTGPDLFAASRPNDLPPRWDGMPVDWQGWRTQMLAHLCPPPVEQEPCPRCRSTAPQKINRGTVYLPAGVRMLRRRILQGRPVVAILHAWRCPDCGHDQVLDDLHDGRLWDLEPDDYHDAGSDHPGTPT